MGDDWERMMKQLEADNPPAVIVITIERGGYEIDAYVQDNVPASDLGCKPSAFVCRDFRGDINPTAMAVSLFDELSKRFQDPKFEDKFEHAEGNVFKKKVKRKKKVTRKAKLKKKGRKR